MALPPTEEPEKRPVSDIAFTPSVKAEQAARGSRAQYERIENGRGWASTINEDLATQLAATRSFYLATANREGQPYIQHRGGPPGFLHMLDEHTLAFADLAGNRQYITIGNLAENPRAFIFIMDYARRRRVKIWGRAWVVENDDELLSRLRPSQGNAKAERAILFAIDAWDRNCPQHIPQLVAIEDVEATLRRLQDRIEELEAELEHRTEPPNHP